jgi:protein tyrosine phosphatase
MFFPTDITSSSNSHDIMLQRGLIKQGIKYMSEHRYCNIIPFDANIVSCSLGYINMSHIHFQPENSFYFIAQAPLEHTMEKFWMAIFENDISIIACLASYGNQCVPYTTSSSSSSSKSISWKLISENSLADGKFMKRVIRVQKPIPTTITPNDNNQPTNSRDIIQLQMNVWPNYGIPRVQDLVEFIKLVDHTQTQIETGGNLLVHCSGGVGRSGTFIAIHRCWKTFTGKTTTLNELIDSTVLSLRRQRHPWCVEGSEQYDLIAETVLRLIE